MTMSRDIQVSKKKKKKEEEKKKKHTQFTLFLSSVRPHEGTLTLFFFFFFFARL